MSVVDPLPAPRLSDDPPDRPAAASLREVVVTPPAELDLRAVDALEQRVREVRDAGATDLVLDLRGVTFLDSAGLRLLLTLRNAAMRDGYGLTLLEGPPRVQRVFALTATRTLFAWRRAA